MRLVGHDRQTVTGALIATGLTLYSIMAARKARAAEDRAIADGDPQGRLADRPSEIPRPGWWAILKRVWRKIGDDNVGIMAAGVGFYALLSLFPGLTALISLYGLVANPSDVQQFINGSLLPAEATKLVTDQMASLIEAGPAKLGIGLLVSLVFALWSTNYGTSTLIGALNIAYEEREKRSYLMVMLTSLTLTACLVLFGILSLLLVAVLPAIIQLLPLPDTWREVINLVRWPVLAGLVMVALAAVYRYGPSREQARWRWISWGAGLATVVWILVSLGFSFYVSHFSSYDKTYGSLGAVIVLMMWLYLTGYIILVGAEFDAEMEHQTARDTTTGPERPLGSRGAHMADTVAS